MVIVNAGEVAINIPLAAYALDVLIQKGVRRTGLQWKFSSAQAASLLTALVFLKADCPDRDEIFHGTKALEIHGFLGLPFVIEHTLRPDVVAIETDVERVAVIEHLRVMPPYATREE